MDDATCRRLAALNRCFYRRHGEAFAATRSAPWPGWQRLASHLPPPAAGQPLRVLDVGCGHGRLATFLAAALPWPVAYVGVDGSPTMVRLARRHLAPLPAVQLQRRELAALREPALPAGPFQLVALLGVLHHLPGAHVRRRLLAAAATRLAPGGVLALTVWRFASEPRFAGKVIPWAELNRRLRRPLDLARLEEGDVLLPFGHDPTALRYCHAVSDAELAEWRAVLPPLTDDYLADGAGGQLNRYLLFRATV